MDVAPRTLGSELAVSAMGLGCMGLSEFYGDPVAEAAGIALIHRALDLGITLLDTADMYGSGDNERLVGRALAGRRNQAVVATKFAVMRGQDGSFTGINGRPEYVKTACEESLRRLGIDHIDLYYQHRVDPQVPIEETVGAMSRLCEEGTVRYLGLSEASPETLRRAQSIHPIAALQTEYSLWSRDPEDTLLPTCAELGIGFVPYSPLGRGFLTGQIKSIEDLAATDYRRTSPRFQEDNFQKNLELVARVETIARSKGCTAAQLALAWLLGHPSGPAPIPGTTRIPRLEENLGALAVDLTPKDRDEIDAVAPLGSAAGDRYSAAGMMSIDR